MLGVLGLGLDGSMLDPNCVIAKDVKSCSYCYYVKCALLMNALAKTGATYYHAQLGLPDKIRAIKGLIVCNDWDLEPLDLLNTNSLALGYYQPSPEV